jgi:hypothetical protein
MARRERVTDAATVVVAVVEMRMRRPRRPSADTPAVSL